VTGSIADNDDIDDSVGDNDQSDDDNDVSYISFDDDEDDDVDNPSSSTNKRQKLLQSTTSSSTTTTTPKVKHSWKLDKNNYNVPFVGTSVTKGETGTINRNGTSWPTGFMEVYRRYSPLGVELNKNEFISALPPGGVHKLLCKDDDSGGDGGGVVTDNDGGNDESSGVGGGKRRKKKRGTTTTTTTKSNEGQQSRGKIISITLQTKYWTAVNEWILSFVPIDKLRSQLHWKQIDYYSSSSSTNNNSKKCALPPQIMTVLIKERLPEWIDAIHKYTARQQYYTQVQQKERKEQRQRQKKQLQLKQQKLSKEEKAMEEKRLQEIEVKNERVQRRLMKQQSREQALLLSALYCLTSLCHLSNGTAREVLRRLSNGSSGGISTTVKDAIPSSAAVGHSGGGGGKFAGKGSPSGNADSGTEWMVQLFQQGNKSSSSTSIKPLVECVRLVCTLLETQDFIVLSRLTEVPSPGWATKRGGGKKDVGNFGIAQIALRYGIQRLLDIVRQSQTGNDDGDDERSVDDDIYAECIARLLRGVNFVILPSSETKNQNVKGGSSKKDNKGGFVLGMGATADLLSGEVLGSLSELSLLAPQFDPTLVSIQDIINGDDVYDDLDSIETAAVEARRVLFALLADTRRSPFLRDSSSSFTTEKDDQFTAYLPQLSKSLHSLLSGQGHSVSLKMILGLCLRTTPEITPHFFRSLQLSDPKPNYRSLAALTFVEGVVRDIPFPRVKALRDGKMPTTQQILSEIIPNCVTKTLLSKVLQSSCALLTSGGLKLIITLLRRARGVSFDDERGSNMKNSNNAEKDFLRSLQEAVMSHMPELTILLSIPSRFDPFETSSHSNTTIVMLQLCEAFQCYAQIDSSLVANAKYDWVKFLPLEESPKRSFLSAEPLLQYRLLRTLHLVSKLDQISFSSKMLPSALSIMTSSSTATPEAYDAARELALSLLEQEIFPHSDNDFEAMSCRKYETSLWVDVISEDTIQDLMTMIAEARQQSVQHKMTILQALSMAKLGYDSASSVSSLLSLSISYLMSDTEDSRVSFTKEFEVCLIQIATKMLLFQTNAKHFAALIVYSAGEHSPGDEKAAGLHQVAKALLDDSSDANTHLYALSSNIFHGECLLNCMLRVSIGNVQDVIQCNFTPEMMRQCLSLLKYTTEGDCRDELLNLLRQIVVHICAVEGASVVTEIETILVQVQSTLTTVDVEGIMLVLFSMLRSSGSQSMNTELESSLMQDSDETMTGMKVVTSLLRHNIVHAKHHCRDADDIWKECCTAVASDNPKQLRLKHFLLSVVLRMFSDAKVSVMSPLLATTMFHLWAALSDDLEERLSVEVCIHLSDCLAEIFSSPEKGHLAWPVYQSLCKMGMAAFVDSCLLTLFKQDQLGRESKRCFLASVMSYDSTNFVCLAKVLLKNDDKYERLWQSGLLDMAASTLVMKTYTQGSSDEAVEGIMSKVAEVAGNRFLTLLPGMENKGAQVLSLEMIVDVIEKLCFGGYNVSETVQCLQEVIGSLEKGTLVLSAQHEIQIVRLVICVAASFQEEEINESVVIVKAFLRCCKLIPKLLKKVVRTKGEEEELTMLLEMLLGYTANLWERKDCFSDDAISSSSSIVDSLIVSCLKYGMMDTSAFASFSIFGGCLKIIRVILSQSSEDMFATEGTIRPGQVHAMASSHSAFDLAVSKKEELSTRLKSSPISRSDGESQFCEGLSQQQELIRLLLCCVSLDASHVKISTDAWGSVLSAYDASTSVTDGLLRRLLFLYDANKCCENEILLCDYQWGAMCKKHSLRMSADESAPPFDEQQSWEWFLDSLNHDRIRSTLTQFPIADTLVPVAESDVESEFRNASNENDQMDTGMDDMSESSSFGVGDDSDGNNSSAASLDEPKEVTPASKIHSTTDIWRGTGEDPRYSPGFILPLVLGSLEANFPKERGAGKESQGADEMELDKDDDDDDESEEDLAQHQAFSVIARRLCDRGCISLAIASLSSRCPSVRKVAVAICGLFLRALQMKKSHEMKSWRERPQQEMIMASLQRGLTVRRAMQIKKLSEAGDRVELGSTSVSKQRFNVTMLPALSAVFLAKALMIMSRPSDDMYGAMNKYFLRLNDYHGAFQDCFGLPAFLSLYCSSSDDLTRCRTERNWALLTLKDSTVDEFCYRIISQHHVPELIMSSFDSLCDQVGGKSELSLTIDVIQCLIQSGGSRSATHLIKRLGLLSWLHGVISWRSISTVLPFATLKCKFLQLISTAVTSYCDEYSNSDSLDGDQTIFLEKVPLADAVIQICLDGSDASSNESHTVLAAACDTLWTIHVADKKQGLAMQRVGLTSLAQMTNLLTKCVENDELFAQALISMSALPYSVSGDEQHGHTPQLFCELALTFMLEERVRLCRGDTITILKRVYDLMSIFSKLREDTELVTTIMQCRHIAASIRDGVQVWDSFIPFLT